MTLRTILSYINDKFLVIAVLSLLVLGGSGYYILHHYIASGTKTSSVGKNGSSLGPGSQSSSSANPNNSPAPNGGTASQSASPKKPLTALPPSNQAGKANQSPQSLPNVGNFVAVCGFQLCWHGSTFVIHGATAYGTYDQPANEVALAQLGRINILEIVEFENNYHSLSDAMSEATWSRVDNFIATASYTGLHVILNLSSYGQSLQASGQTPTTVDWQPYLSFIANRTNTVTGVQYRNDSTIAMVEIFGEIDAPNYGIHPGTEGTTAQMTAFFHRTETEWKVLAPNILVSSGGFSYINDPNSGIDWQTIVADPANGVCDLEVNSPNDVSGSVNKFTSYCKSIGKPWFLSAWSSCYNSNSYPFYTPTDSAMASHGQDMYNIAKGGSPATFQAVGADFWNLRDEGTRSGTCSLSPSFPLTWAVVRNNAP